MSENSCVNFIIVKLPDKNMTFFTVVKLTVYKFFLFCMYFFLLAEYWESSKFVQPDGLSVQSMLFSWTIFALSLFFAKKIYENENIEGNIFFALYVVYFIPSLVFWEFNPEPWDYIFAQLLYFTVMASAILFMPKFSARAHSPFGFNSVFYVTLILIAGVILVSFFVTRSRFLFSLSDVYGVRMMRVMKDVPLFLSYLFSCCRILLPLLFGIAVYRRAYPATALILFLVLCAFSIDGLKSTAFITLITGAGIFIAWRNIHILNGILGILTCGLLEYCLFDSYLVIDYLRRVLAVPVQLNYVFYDYFSQPDHPFDYFRQSIMGKLGFESSYDLSIFQIIGGEYFDKWEMNANNGLISDAFYNLGWPGLVIMPVLIVIVVRLLDSFVVGVPKQCLLGIVVAFPYWLITSSFFTLFFTHGLVLLFTFLYFLPSFSKNKQISPHG